MESCKTYSPVKKVHTLCVLQEGVLVHDEANLTARMTLPCHLSPSACRDPISYVNVVILTVLRQPYQIVASIQALRVLRCISTLVRHCILPHVYLVEVVGVESSVTKLPKSNPGDKQNLSLRYLPHRAWLINRHEGLPCTTYNTFPWLKCCYLMQG